MRQLRTHRASRPHFGATSSTAAHAAGAFKHVHMDALQPRLRLAPGKKNIGGTGLEGKARTRKKAGLLMSCLLPPRTMGERSLQETAGAWVPVILVATSDLTAKHPDTPAKFPVISAGNSRCKSLILLIQLAFFGQFQAQKPQKYPVIETRSRQTASTANKFNDLETHHPC